MAAVQAGRAARVPGRRLHGATDYMRSGEVDGVLVLRRPAQRSKLSFCGDGPVRVSELCPDTVWDRVRTGQSFLRLVSVRAALPPRRGPPSAVKMDGIHPETTGQRLVSNCPRSLQELMAACPGQLPAAWEKPEDDEAQWAATGQ